MKEKVPVIKAFTKTYAMAGLRLGYMIADTDFVCDVQKTAADVECVGGGTNRRNYSD